MHSRSKDRRDIYCRECKASRSASYYARNSEKVKNAVKNHAAANREAINAQRKIFRQENAARLSVERATFRKQHPGYRADYYKQWYVENRTIRLAKMAEYQKQNRQAANERNSQYSKKNRPKLNAASAKYYASKMMAMPVWANLGIIDSMYAKAHEMTAMTGSRHHVDHIIPLRSKIVCGLHCEANLQILLGPENLRKSNRHWPDMP